MNFGLFVMGLLLFLTSVFLMLLILVQRGRGGGLTGALGGMGGQSAFGAKAGDTFTRITVVSSIIWILFCMLTIAVFNPPPREAKKPTRDNMFSGAGAEQGDDETDAGDTDLNDQPGGVDAATTGDEATGESGDDIVNQLLDVNAEQSTDPGSEDPSKEGPDKTGEDKTGEDKSGEDKSGEDKSGEDKSGEDKSGEDKSGDKKKGADQEKDK